MADRQETSADIIAKMRKPHDEICAKCHEEPNESCPYCGDPNGCNSPKYGQWPGVMTQLADELEAAHKRERGDCAKLREALKECLLYIACAESGTIILNGKLKLDPEKISKSARKVLAATENEGGVE